MIQTILCFLGFHGDHLFRNENGTIWEGVDNGFAG